MTAMERLSEMRTHARRNEARARIIQLTPANGVYAEHQVADGLPGETRYRKVQAWALIDTGDKGNPTAVEGMVYWHNGRRLMPASFPPGFLGYKGYKETPEWKIAHFTPQKGSEFLGLFESEELTSEELAAMKPVMTRSPMKTLADLFYASAEEVAYRCNHTTVETLRIAADQIEKNEAGQE